MSRKTRAPFKPYAVAVLCVFVAIVLTQLLEPFLGSVSFAFFYAAVTVSSWYGGIKPGLLAIGQFRSIAALQDAEIELNLKPILENLPGLN
jgi:hypothetical protein